MTLPVERTRAVCATRAFLSRLLSPADTPRVPGGIRGEASALLRHYPGDVDLFYAARGAPATWGPPPSLEEYGVAQAEAIPPLLDALRLAVAECQQRRHEHAAFIAMYGSRIPSAAEHQAEISLHGAIGRAERAVLEAAEALVAGR